MTILLFRSLTRSLLLFFMIFSFSSSWKMLLYRYTSNKRIGMKSISFLLSSSYLEDRLSSSPLQILNEHFSTESFPQHSRFWLKSIDIKLPISDIKGDPVKPEKVIEEVRIIFTAMQDSKTFPKSETGMIILPSYQLLIPLHQNIIQTQHAVIESALSTIPSDSFSHNDNTTKMLICGFYPRAAQITRSDEDMQRPIHSERLQALNYALSQVTDVTGEILLSESYAGTPAARIYRSFIAPRPNKDYSQIHSIERAAERTALQIHQAIRQLRADAATYLRNTDKSFGVLPSEDSTSPSNIHETTKSLPENRQFYPVTLVLDNIRSAHNVGSMFRTAETAGIQEIITTGITAHPPNVKLRKTALSAVEVVPTRHFSDVIVAIKQLQQEGYKIIVMETTSKSIMYTNYYPNIQEKIAIVVGNEIYGVDPTIMEIADQIVEIPTNGLKNSLNVACAASIMIFEMIRKYSILSKD